MQIHDFHPLPTWAREAKNERDPSATIRISGEAKLPSSFLDVKTDPGCKVRAPMCALCKTIKGQIGKAFPVAQFATDLLNDHNFNIHTYMIS